MTKYFLVKQSTIGLMQQRLHFLMGNCTLVCQVSRQQFKKTLSVVLVICHLFASHDRFIYLGFYVAFNTVQVISRQVVGRAEETSTYSSLGFCTVNCRPTASNYQLSHLRPCWGANPGLRGGRRECYHSATVAPSSHDRYLFLIILVLKTGFLKM